MKKKKKQSSALTGSVNSEEKKKPNIKMLLLLVFNTAVVFGFYRFMLSYPHFEIVLGSYMTILAALSISYVVYNRGFSRNGITVDMLPDSMTNEEKVEFIEDAARRKKSSKWMLAFIFPFVFTFGLDAISWLITDNILSFLKV